MAWGESKAQVVKNVVEGEINSNCPASYLQKHDNITFYVDETAASMLTRVVSPWKVGPLRLDSEIHP
jgi:glucosamine-6-phosphate deaminase